MISKNNDKRSHCTCEFDYRFILVAFLINRVDFLLFSALLPSSSFTQIFNAASEHKALFISFGLDIEVDNLMREEE